MDQRVRLDVLQVLSNPKIPWILSISNSLLIWAHKFLESRWHVTDVFVQHIFLSVPGRSFWLLVVVVVAVITFPRWWWWWWWWALIQSFTSCRGPFTRIASSMRGSCHHCQTFWKVVSLDQSHSHLVHFFIWPDASQDAGRLSCSKSPTTKNCIKDSKLWHNVWESWGTAKDFKDFLWKPGS